MKTWILRLLGVPPTARELNRRLEHAEEDIADLAERFRRFQNRHLMREARESASLPLDLVEAAQGVLRDQGSVPAQSDPALLKQQLAAKLRRH